MDVCARACVCVGSNLTWFCNVVFLWKQKSLPDLTFINICCRNWPRFCVSSRGCTRHHARVGLPVAPRDFYHHNVSHGIYLKYAFSIYKAKYDNRIRESPWRSWRCLICIITRGLCSYNARLFNDDVMAVGSLIGGDWNYETTHGSIVVECCTTFELGPIVVIVID